MANQRARELRKNRTDAEKKLWTAVRALKTQGFKFRQQAPVDPYIVDLVCLSHRLIIEIDGATHSTDAEIASDTRRQAFLVAQGFRVMRVTNDEVYRNLDGVMQTIFNELQYTPTPTPQGGGGIRTRRTRS